MVYRKTRTAKKRDWSGLRCGLRCLRRISVTLDSTGRPRILPERCQIRVLAVPGSRTPQGSILYARGDPMRQRVRCVLFALVLGTPAAVQAQVLYGSLTGNVTDPTGSAPPGAKVGGPKISPRVFK